MSNFPTSSNNKKFLKLINEAHEDSGRTLQEVADLCNIDKSYLSRILHGTRKAKRDLMINLSWSGWGLGIEQGDEILKEGGYKTILNWKKAGWE